MYIPSVRGAVGYIIDLLEGTATCGLQRYRGSRAGSHQRAPHYRDAYLPQPLSDQKKGKFYEPTNPCQGQSVVVSFPGHDTKLITGAE